MKFPSLIKPVQIDVTFKYGAQAVIWHFRYSGLLLSRPTRTESAHARSGSSRVTIAKTEKTGVENAERIVVCVKCK